MRVNEHGYSLDDALGSVGPGWEAIIRELWSHKTEDVIVSQVKEKFGGLRVYYSSPADMLDDFDAALDIAEDAAERTCDTCGAPGEIVKNSRGWLKCGCPLHRD